MQKEPVYRALFKDPLKYRWLMFCIAAVIYFLACFHRVLPTVIAHDLTLAFDADATTLGLIASAYFYLYSLIQPPVGVLTDTIGPRRVVTFFTVIACAGSVVFGMAVNPAMAVCGRALIGIGVGGIFIPTLKIFSKWYRANEFASLTGLLIAIGYLGGISASLPLTYMVLFMGWRVSFVALGSFSLFLAGVFWLVVRDTPGDKGWASIEDGMAQSSEPMEDPPESINTLARLGIVARNTNFWMITISIFFVGGAGLTFTGLWAVPFLVDIYAFTRVEASSFLMVSLIGLSTGALGFGVLTDKFRIDRRRIIIISLALGFGQWALFSFYGSQIPPAAFIPMFFLIGVCGGGSIPLFMTMTKELFPEWLGGTALGLMNPAAFFATALFQPFSGYLMDRIGKLETGAYPFEAYQDIFVMFLIFYGISILALFFLKAPAIEAD